MPKTKKSCNDLLENLVLKGSTYFITFFCFTSLDDKAMLKEYPTTVNGMFDSWRERWSQEEAREIDVILDILVERNLEHFKTS